MAHNARCGRIVPLVNNSSRRVHEEFAIRGIGGQLAEAPLQASGQHCVRTLADAVGSAFSVWREVAGGRRSMIHTHAVGLGDDRSLGEHFRRHAPRKLPLKFDGLFALMAEVFDVSQECVRGCLAQLIPLLLTGRYEN